MRAGRRLDRNQVRDERSRDFRMKVTGDRYTESS